MSGKVRSAARTADPEGPPRSCAPLTPNTQLLEARHCAELLGQGVSAFWTTAQRPDFPVPRARRGAGRRRVWLRSEVEAYIRNLPVRRGNGHPPGGEEEG